MVPSDRSAGRRPSVTTGRPPPGRSGLHLRGEARVAWDVHPVGAQGIDLLLQRPAHMIGWPREREGAAGRKMTYNPFSIALNLESWVAVQPRLSLGALQHFPHGTGWP